MIGIPQSPHTGPKTQLAARAKIWKPPPACPNSGAAVPLTNVVPLLIVTDPIAAAGLLGGRERGTRTAFSNSQAMDSTRKTLPDCAHTPSDSLALRIGHSPVVTEEHKFLTARKRLILRTLPSPATLCLPFMVRSCHRDPHNSIAGRIASR